MTLNQRLDTAVLAAEEAGLVLLRFRERHGRTLEGSRKLDGTIVTEADHLSSKKIKEILHDRFPDEFILDEEDLGGHRQERPESFWIIDPLDGTLYFAGGQDDYPDGEDDYCVLIAYIQQGQPAIGVIYFPERGELLCGGPGLGAKRLVGTTTTNLVLTRPNSVASLTMLGSDNPEGRHVYERLAAHWGVQSEERGKSSGDKYRRLLMGEKDLVVTRFGSPDIWDIAPAHALIRELRGEIRTLTGRPINYRTTTKLDEGTIAIGSPELIPILSRNLPEPHLLRA